MTCIAGLVENGVVHIGGDSAGTNRAFQQTIRADEKVFKKGEFLFGFTSSYRMGQLLRFSLSPPCQFEKQDDYDYLCTAFINAVRTCLKEGGFAQKDKEEESGGVFLLGYRGRLYQVYSDYQVGRPTEPYAACGCGDDLALGALFATDGMDMTPKDRLTIALEAAQKFSAGVKGPFVIEKL